MSRELEIDRRARLRSALVEAGRAERASDALRASLLAAAAMTAVTTTTAPAAASSSTVVSSAGTARRMSLARASGEPGAVRATTVAPPPRAAFAVRTMSRTAPVWEKASATSPG